MDSNNIHPLAGHVPGYVVAADGSDYLFTFMIFFTVGLILLIGIAYLTLHAMPERMAHESNHSQMQVVGILALLALFTHNNMFWVIAIMVAAFRPPDFMTPLTSIAHSLSAMAMRPPAPIAVATQVVTDTVQTQEAEPQTGQKPEPDAKPESEG